jgi:hypothetical protein
MGVSIASLFFALLLLSDLLVEVGGAQAVVPGVACLLLFPTAYYFATFYTESLFLLATVAAIWAARRRRWWLSGVAGFAASLVRINGALVFLPVLWYAWEAAGRRWKGFRPAPLIAALAPLAGAVVFPIYLWYRWRDPLLYVHAKASGWPQKAEPFWSLAIKVGREGWLRFAGGGKGRQVFLAEVGSVLLFLVLTVCLFRVRRVGEGLYAASTLFLVLNSGTLDAIHRYVLVLFPCFMVLSEFLRRRPALAFCYAFFAAGLQMIFIFRFVHWMWVA